MRTVPGVVRLSVVLIAVLMVWPLAAQTVTLPRDPQSGSHGVRAVWDVDKAWHETTPTRERICLNGLWRWQPAASRDAPPTEGWGYFKVPGCWPGLSDWLQKDCQTLFPHPDWKATNLAGLTEAWYEREITVPPGWAGRRISLTADVLNSLATVFVDGKVVGEMRFPLGTLDVTAACPPGRHTLSLMVSALPLKAVLLSYNDTSQAREMRGSVQRRGLCGDVFLVSAPPGPRLGTIRIATSVPQGAITLTPEVLDLPAGAQATLHAEISDQGKTVTSFDSKPFSAADLPNGTFAWTQAWKPDKLWDLNTPGNQYEVQVTLRDAAGKALDVAAPRRFGFREFGIQGRDFVLNGSRIFLSVVPLDNAAVGAAWATYDGARESLLRLKSWGINFVYTHNYDCQPGSHLAFEEILRAADDVGMLVALSQPHYGQYDWQAKDADQSNGYARHAQYYTQIAGNHPSVVCYSTSHNATGYVEDMNPEMIDGVQDPRQSWAKTSAQRALRAEGLIKSFDPTRVVYHHSSGNLGSMHTNNFYANFTPNQELCDWFEHWATTGVKPLFLCEFGAPLSWDFTMYRGWYRNSRTFGSAVVPWELCLAEWNSQLYGDAAFKLSEVEKKCLRWEAGRFKSGQLWHRWDYPYEIGAWDYKENIPAAAQAITDQWRAFRTWGVSAINTWDYHAYWQPREGLTPTREELPVDWDNLQRPGYSPDYIDQRYARRDLAYRRTDWVANAAGAALERNNGPLLAYLGGKASGFTEKGHNFVPGETVEKQLIVINNSRATVTADCTWTLALPASVVRAASSREPGGSQKVTLKTGEQERIPLKLALPAGLAVGAYPLQAQVKFSAGETQEDTFTVNVMAAPQPVAARPKLAIWDPAGETTKLLAAQGLTGQAVEPTADLSAFDALVIGKQALTPDGPAPDPARVKSGLRVIVFEQTAAALEQRLGFRVEEYGLRNAFKRVPDHPLLAGISNDNLRDWRGDATLLPPRLTYTLSDTYKQCTPTVKWCGLDVPHIWRCGSRGNVASVLIEKPACGSFRPVVDGGYSLQFSPLLEYREGKGLVLFCQLDVTGRSEADPCAATLVRNLVQYAAQWQPAPVRPVAYVGDEAGRKYLQRTGITPAVQAPAGGVLIVGPGGDKATTAQAVADLTKSGGKVLALGLNQDEAQAVLPTRPTMADGEHINCAFAPLGQDSLLAGLGPADAHNRAPKQMPLVTGGAEVVGDGVLATQGNDVVLYQMPPWTVTKAEGAAAFMKVDDQEAAEGKQSAVVSLGSAMETGTQIGQSMKQGGGAGKTYTFSALIKPVNDAVTLHLEIERSVRPWDRCLKTPDIVVAPGQWTEVHATFTMEKAFAEGWQAYLASGQDGALFRLDLVRLYEGEYAPWQPGQTADQWTNLLANPGFEQGTESWWSYFGEQYNLRRTFRRSACLMNTIVGNLGAQGATPLLERFAKPVAAGEQRWLTGMYLDQPITWDDPYRFFCW